MHLYVYPQAIKKKIIIFQCMESFSKVSRPEHWDWPCHGLGERFMLTLQLLTYMVWSQLAPFKYFLPGIYLKRLLLSDVPPYFQYIECITLTNYKVLSSPTVTDTKSLWVRRGPIYKGWKSGHCLSCLLICLNFGFHEDSCLRFWNLLFVSIFFSCLSDGKKKKKTL